MVQTSKPVSAERTAKAIRSPSHDQAASATSPGSSTNQSVSRIRFTTRSWFCGRSGTERVKAIRSPLGDGTGAAATVLPAMRSRLSAAGARRSRVSQLNRAMSADQASKKRS